MNMVERVARAMAANYGLSLAHTLPRSLYADARAAIAAMREPTDAQLFAVASHPHDRDCLKQDWQAMIDAALEDR